MTRSRALAAPAIVWLLLGLCGAQLQESKPGLVELTADSFVSDMKALPEDRWVLAEFYAHWWARPVAACAPLATPPWGRALQQSRPVRHHTTTSPQANPARCPSLRRCPACQRFQPEYEKVAAYFAERGDKEPGVTVARLDCANHVSSLRDQ